MDVRKALRAFSGDIPANEDFVALQKEGVIQVSDFQGATGKYFSTVVDEKENGKVLRESSRIKILGTYIHSGEGKLAGVKIERYEKRNGQLQPNPTCINISLDQVSVFQELLEFLQKADLKAISKGKITLAESLSLDKDLQAKLVAISKDTEGRKILEEFLQEDYVASGNIATSAIKLLKGIKDDTTVSAAIQELAEDSGLDIVDLIRLGLSPSKVAEKLKQLEEFRNLISKPDVKEVSEIQAALQKMPWIFGPEYASLDFRAAGDSGNPDRRLKRIDGLSDILEVKLPKEEVLRQDSMNRCYISPKLAESLGQLTGYLEHFYSEFRIERDDETKDEVTVETYGKYYKPKGILLIGRRYKKDGTESRTETVDALPRNLRRLTSYFHWIDVLTYDDLIERAENGLTALGK